MATGAAGCWRALAWQGKGQEEGADGELGRDEKKGPAAGVGQRRHHRGWRRRHVRVGRDAEWKRRGEWNERTGHMWGIFDERARPDGRTSSSYHYRISKQREY
jgi:hypothetical protein